MKSLLKLLIFCVVIFLVLDYIDSHHIFPVKEKVAAAGELLKEQYNAIRSSGERKRQGAGVDESQASVQVASVIKIEKSGDAETVQNKHSDPSVLSGDDLEWVKGVTKKYSPDCWYMLMAYENLPSTIQVPTRSGTATTRKSSTTFYYLSGDKRSEILSRMPTNVHETAHAYCHLNVYQYAKDHNIKIDFDNVYEYFYVSPEENYFVTFPRKLLFPSAELTSVITSDLRTFRFDDYIDGHTSTQSEGVFGLLNELHAYYLGSKNNYDLLEAWKITEGSDPLGFYSWVQHAQSELSAFYEFDFFIKEYLLYMKNNYSNEYQSLKSYPQFREAYNGIRRTYKDLIAEYRKKIDTEILRLNSSGKAECRIKEGSLWVKLSGRSGSTGTTIFSEAPEILLPVLESDRYREIEKDFRI